MNVVVRWWPQRLGRWLAWALPRPLDPVRSIKVKLAIVIAVSGAVGGMVFWQLTGWVPLYSVGVSAVVAVLVSQLIGHGMTRPLREMTVAAQTMARGDYALRVRATSKDEVGELGRAFNMMASDLEVADRHRRELIANVSHELRTPIAALQAVLENIVDGVAEPDPDTLATALNQTSRLGTLVGELLDLSRLDAGASILRPGPVQIAPFLTDAVRQATLAGGGPTSAGAGVRATPSPRIKLSVEPPHLSIRADRGRLHQIVANLLDNALRHSPPNGVVSVTAADDGSNGLVLTVVDQGPGIPAEDQVAVFRRFTHGGRTDGSTGLGLAIARWAAELHGGTIQVATQTAGTGCRLVVTIPSAPSPAGDDSPRSSHD